MHERDDLGTGANRGNGASQAPNRKGAEVHEEGCV